MSYRAQSFGQKDRGGENFSGKACLFLQPPPHFRPLPKLHPVFSESMLMDAPKCRICGERHWSRVCDDSVTKRVTSSVSVTPIVTKMARESDAEFTRLTGLIFDGQKEIERLRDEVARLKRELAEAHGSKKAAMSGAERVRLHRERKKS